MRRQPVRAAGSLSWKRRSYLPGLMLATAALLLACRSAAGVRFEEAGLITARNNDEPAQTAYATLVRAGDPFLYVVFVLASDGPRGRYAVDVRWRREGRIVEDDHVTAETGSRSWALCDACHVRGAYEVELEVAGQKRTLSFVAQ